MTTPAADPSAPAAVAADPAAPAAPVAPADPIASLVPADPGTAPVADPKPADPVAPSLVDEGPEWHLYDGVKGTGKMPDWYKADKYKTVAEQAKAYSELEKRFGAFTGAPEKYEAPPMPEGVEGEFLTDHPMFDTATKWARENKFSQKAYNEMMGMLAQYEASQAPDLAEEKKAIGENADQRLTEVSLWAKANLAPEQFSAYREAMGVKGAAKVFTAIEAIVSKTRQPSLPKPGELPGDAPISPLVEINEMQAKKGPDGKRLYETDPKWRALVEQKRVAYFSAAQQA